MLSWRGLVAAALLARLGLASHQFHLSLVGNSVVTAGNVDYMLDWVTPSGVDSSVLIYGSSATSLNKEIEARGAGAVEEDDASVECWSALLHDLKPGQTIYYAIKGDTEDDAEPKSFTVPKGDITWAVFGDLAAPMQKQAAGVSLPALKEECDKGVYQGIVNLGDLGYELVKKNGQNYMEELEHITSKVPMLATIGNHEHEHAMSPEFALQNFQRRFASYGLGAGTVSGSASPEFFSYNSGLIHFVFINTEIYGNEAYFALQEDGSWKPDEKERREMAALQADWLAYDLSRVNREETPYVVVCTHRPPFKTPLSLSTAGNKFVKEILPLLSEYNVDLYLAGHEHTYLYFEESEYLNYRVPPIIISGSSGNNEYIREIEEIKMEGFEQKVVIPKYGYGYLTATKKALKWKWGSTGSDSSHTPKPEMWTLEDEQTIPRRDIPSAAEKVGKPIKEPEAVQVAWGVAGSGASSGSTAGDADYLDKDSPMGTVAASNGTNNKKSPTPTPSASSAKSLMSSLLGIQFVVIITWFLG
ncbi:hypothetical protein Poli38472_006042 [Pythium oligandrum]|uniref:Purple acid phosphatase n=1 Tax=Pythium oligandrum TaxID=41045 RepID=A0A8K1CS52_PYTOL|nr:hypothetical protein Poli38472_006042 [Pythium oligandrum]|eukprot:TMW68574.1 hypothetical protein Poli38472_006042 [Pythium oligandrum]